jgi:hypothetical protein
MSESSPAVSHYRCICPHCQKVLKIRVDWAGKKGVCPQCRGAVDFPPFRMPSASSATQKQLLRLIGEADNPTLDDGQIDRLALLFSQGTCRDYQMADQLLRDRTLSPRQWRRVLSAADLRESMRLRIEQRLTAPPAPDPDDSEAAALWAVGDTASPNAWRILARYLYFQRHGYCDKCNANPTGMHCIYLTFDGFLAARSIPLPRADHWHDLLHLNVGL